jgi:D-lactate dehydrogenase (cytochrome)
MLHLVPRDNSDGAQPGETGAHGPQYRAAIDQLLSRFGDRVTVSEAVRTQHGAGEGVATPMLPDAVLFARSTDEVADAVRIASRHAMPIITYGAGTSLEGQLQAVKGGLCINMAGMDAILAINDPDLDCRVQAGVTREALNSELRTHGLFFPLDPGANATIGGMAATRASGTNAVRYGTMREVTMGLTVVTPQGEVITTGGRSRKSSAGYDLTRLYVGSEGTLGIITEVQLRLFGIPEMMASAVCQFPTIEGAVQSAMLAMSLAVPLARIELLDAVQMQACITYSKLQGFAALPTLFLEFHGTEMAVGEQVELMNAITRDHGGGEYRWATRTEERTELWKARHSAYYAAKALIPGAEAHSTDACVPISRLADCIAECQELAQTAGILAPIVGHVGDGNFHMLLVFDPGDAGQRQAADKLSLDVARCAIAMGGTCTGEHGIGTHKIAALREEHGAGVGIMQQLKHALDPQGIMNPGKILAG